MFRFILSCLILTAFSAVLLRAQDTGTGPNLLPGDFESGSLTYNPWAGVDDLGNLRVWAGTQRAVSDSGNVQKTSFSPSVAVGDLNGDGLPDLVVGDARGFIWYFANSGKPNAPVFTHGEILPLWLGGGKGGREGDAVPRIQLVDYTGEKKLSIVAGNFLGGLYYMHNMGSATAPAFRMRIREEDEMPTHSKDILWCNYLAPFLYDWTGTGRLDLVMGDGSYSANSVYYFTNMGSNDRPIFNEDHRQKLIPGMGREHLTPQVLDWNHDGKPDIISGERTGYINVYLNTAANKTDPPIFDPDNPLHVSFGSTQIVGTLTTVSTGDLNHDGLFDFIIGSNDGRITYSYNIGTPEAPKFGPLLPLKGVNPYPKIITPNFWSLDRFNPGGSPYELLECVNATVDPTFKPPPDFKGHGAMKFSVMRPANTYFNDTFVPEDPSRFIDHNGQFQLVAETRYILSFWVRSEGDISDLSWAMNGIQHNDTTEKQVAFNGESIGTSGAWTRVNEDVRIATIDDSVRNKNKETGIFSVRFVFKGAGTLYFDDISLRLAAPSP